MIFKIAIIINEPLSKRRRQVKAISSINDFMSFLTFFAGLPFLLR